jgi:hypothetical protein
VVDARSRMQSSFFIKHMNVEPRRTQMRAIG